MNDLATKFKNVLMPKILKTKLVDWALLFQHFDVKLLGLLAKAEIKPMMIESGLTSVTDAEVEFTLNNMSKFKPTLTATNFYQWGTQMVKIP